MPSRPPPRRLLAFLDDARIDALLEPFVPDRADRAFLVRAMLHEGPAHHRGANYVLLALVGEVLARLGAPPAAAAVPGTPTVPVPMRLPPHLDRDPAHAHYPIALDVSRLEALAHGRADELAAMVDCLTDGPPQHAVANVAMVNLLAAILRRLPPDRDAG